MTQETLAWRQISTNHLVALVAFQNPINYKSVSFFCWAKLRCETTAHCDCLMFFELLLLESTDVCQGVLLLLHCVVRSNPCDPGCGWTAVLTLLLRILPSLEVKGWLLGLNRTGANISRVLIINLLSLLYQTWKLMGLNMWDHVGHTRK